MTKATQVEYVRRELINLIRQRCCEIETGTLTKTLIKRGLNHGYGREMEASIIAELSQGTDPQVVSFEELTAILASLGIELAYLGPLITVELGKEDFASFVALMALARRMHKVAIERSVHIAAQFDNMLDIQQSVLKYSIPPKALHE